MMNHWKVGSCKIFGEKKFGIVFNYVENYSNEFAEKAATVVKPLLTVAGLPSNGLSFLLFMGNYGFTPFGIHKEAVGEEGVLFHLGPGSKQFYTWDSPEYNNVKHNTKVFHNVTEMLPDAKCYELKPGDAMFIPHQVYHIANTGEFSVSLVLDYINPPVDLVENELLRNASDEDLCYGDTYQSSLPMDSSSDEWNTTLNHRSLLRKLETALRRKILAIKSNGGILRKSKEVTNNFPNYDFQIKGIAPFPIYVDQDGGDFVVVFARGHRFKKKHNPHLAELIDQLNSGEMLDISAMQKKLEPDWDTIDLFGFITDLTKIEAIRIDAAR